MDIFGDDIDSFFNNEGELNANIRDDNIEEAEEDSGEADEEGKTDENGEPIKVEPKKRSVRRPQVNEFCSFKLNEKQNLKFNSFHNLLFILASFEC